jgi:hypothetical protein
MRSIALTVTTVSALALLAGTASPYPPHNCGRESVNGKTVVVQTHGPTCGFAKDGARAWIARHRAPSGFACKTYPGDEPAFCKHRHKKNYYFLATKP